MITAIAPVPTKVASVAVVMTVLRSLLAMVPRRIIASSRPAEPLVRSVKISTHDAKPEASVSLTIVRPKAVSAGKNVPAPAAQPAEALRFAVRSAIRILHVFPKAPVVKTQLVEPPLCVVAKASSAS